MTFFPSTAALLRSSLLRPSAAATTTAIRTNTWIMFCGEPRKNPTTGKLELPDPTKLLMPARHEINRMTPPDAHKLLYYEKPAMKKKRLKNQKLYKKREYKVKELIDFIKVKREYEAKLK